MLVQGSRHGGPGSGQQAVDQRRGKEPTTWGAEVGMLGPPPSPPPDEDPPPTSPSPLPTAAPEDLSTALRRLWKFSGGPGFVVLPLVGPGRENTL